MAKGRQSNKAAKKKPALTLKEKRAVKKSKGETKSFLEGDRLRTPSG